MSMSMLIVCNQKVDSKNWVRVIEVDSRNWVTVIEVETRSFSKFSIGQTIARQLSDSKNFLDFSREVEKYQQAAWIALLAFNGRTPESEWFRIRIAERCAVTRRNFGIIMIKAITKQIRENVIERLQEKQLSTDKIQQIATMVEKRFREKKENFPFAEDGSYAEFSGNKLQSLIGELIAEVDKSHSISVEKD